MSPGFCAANRGPDCSRGTASAQYRHPIRIVAFNTVEGWSRDVTMDIADELRRRYDEFGELPDSIFDFMDANRR